ncbi:MAG: hypothetical protein E6X82_03495 [Clostridium sp.]|nr:hypothetical protein [Clostridium sp.]
MEELKEFKEKLMKVKGDISNISFVVTGMLEEIEKIENGEIDKTLDASRKIIKNYIDKNGNVLDKKHQIDLFNKLRAVNRGKISLISLLKKLEINYSYQGDGDWKDIVVG